MRKSLPAILLLALVCCLLPLYALAGDSSVSGYAWIDEGSGVYAAGASPYQYAQVSLYRLEEDGSESLSASAACDRTGFYEFTELGPGQYRLRVQIAQNDTFIQPQEGGSVLLPAVGNSSFSLPFTLEEEQAFDGAHIGVTRTSCYIKAIAFEDLNQNGGRSTNEPFMRDVPVTIYYEAGGELIEIATATTDKNGEALFLHISPGTYRIAATLPAPYIFGPMGEKISLWYNCIVPADSSHSMTPAVTVVRGDSLGIGIGAVSTGSLRGFLWNDSNMNGLRESVLEGGFAGATVRLTNEAAGVDREIVTGADGAYRFDRLLAGEYLLSVTLPENSMFSLPGGDSLLTQGYSFSDACIVNVESMLDGTVQAVGVMPVTSLSVRVYNDLNANGAQDEGEPPFAGAALEVSSGDTVVASAVSDGEGVARIPVLRGGDVDVRLTLPDGQIFTVEGADSDFTAPAGTGDLTIPVSVAHGGETVLRAGVTQPASVSGVLFDDRNLNGILDGGETGLEGFTVQAVNTAGAVVAQTVTGADGSYAFGNLLPASHTVRFQLVEAYVCSDYSESGAPQENHVVSQTAEYGETAPYLLTPGQSLAGISAAIFRSATISGQVLLETGVASLPAEGGMQGVRVRLLDEYGTEVNDTTVTYTDENGSFYLKGALPGTYLLEYSLPQNAAFVHPITGDESFVTDSFTVQVADDLVRSPLYAIHTGSLSGVVYLDENLNGRYDSGESVVPGAAIQLLNTDLDMTYETASLDNGQYILDYLRPGAYTMRAILPDGLCFAFDASSPLAPQVETAAEAAFGIGVGEEMFRRNIAAGKAASLTGTIYFDADNDGGRNPIDNGAAGVTVSLMSVDGPQSYSVQTDENGVFRLDAMVPGSYDMRVTLAGDCIPAKGNSAVLSQGFWTSRLFIDNSEEKQLDYGILRYASVSGHIWSLDGTLTGVAGRSVTLFTPDSSLPLATAESDEYGAFTFRQLLPGSYRVSCDLPDESYNYAREADAALRPASLPGSEPDFPVGYDGYFTLPMGADLLACDIGIGAMGELGDTAWLDLDGNGLQDSGEPCIPGIAIQLFQYGELAAEGVTDSTGHYLFTDLYPGAYIVRVTMPKELRATVRRADFPLLASVLQETDALIAEAVGVIVPSADRNLNCDFGFTLREEGVYPQNMEQLAAIDWSFGGQRK